MLQQRKVKQVSNVVYIDKLPQRQDNPLKDIVSSAVDVFIAFALIAFLAITLPGFF